MTTGRESLLRLVGCVHCIDCGEGFTGVAVCSDLGNCALKMCGVFNLDYSSIKL